MALESGRYVLLRVWSVLDRLANRTTPGATKLIGRRYLDGVFAAVGDALTRLDADQNALEPDEMALLHALLGVGGVDGRRLQREGVWLQPVRLSQVGIEMVRAEAEAQQCSQAEVVEAALRYYLGRRQTHRPDAAAPRSGRPARLSCPAGHPYAGDNVIFDSLGYRRCRTCHRARNAACQQRRRERKRRERDGLREAA